MARKRIRITFEHERVLSLSRDGALIHARCERCAGVVELVAVAGAAGPGAGDAAATAQPAARHVLVTRGGPLLARLRSLLRRKD